MSEEANFYTEPMLAWRAWIVGDDGELFSVTPSSVERGGLRDVRYPWLPLEKNRASCTKLHLVPYNLRENHSAPEELCKCGFHAGRRENGINYLTWNANRPFNYPNLSMLPACVGVVSLWGKVIEHEHGYRAEFAYPKEVWLPEMIWTLRPLSESGRRKLAEKIEDRYQIPATAITNLREMPEVALDESTNH